MKSEIVTPYPNFNMNLPSDRDGKLSVYRAGLPEDGGVRHNHCFLCWFLSFSIDLRMRAFTVLIIAFDSDHFFLILFQEKFNLKRGSLLVISSIMPQPNSMLEKKLQQGMELVPKEPIETRLAL